MWIFTDGHGTRCLPCATVPHTVRCSVYYIRCLVQSDTGPNFLQYSTAQCMQLLRLYLGLLAATTQTYESQSPEQSEPGRLTFHKLFVLTLAYKGPYSWWFKCDLVVGDAYWSSYWQLIYEKVWHPWSGEFHIKIQGQIGQKIFDKTSTFSSPPPSLFVPIS